MSARQNKKQRKGRNSANNRERTVTTLTEDPNTPYLVPTPSEEPPGSHLSAHLGTKVHNPPMSSQPYQMSSNFGGFQAYAGTFNPPQQPYFPPSQSQTIQQQQTSQQYQHIPPLSPGKNDLEILQHLKQLILDNQHPVFRAVPQPAALAKLYKGPLPAQPSTESGETSGSGLASTTPDPGRLAARISSKDSSSVPLGPSSGNQQHSPRNSYHTSSGNNAVPDSKALVHRIGKSVSSSGGSHSAGLDVRSAVLPTTEEDRDRRYEYSTRQKSDSAPMGDRADYPSNGTKKPSLDDSMDDSQRNRDYYARFEGWSSKQPPVSSESERPGSDRTPNSRGGPAPLSAAASGQADARPSTAPLPDNVRDRDGGANTDTHTWSWQDRNYRRPDYNRPLRGRQQSYHRPRRMSSASDHHRPLANDPPVRRGGPVVDPSQSHVSVDSRGPPTDVVRPSAPSDRVPDEPGVDTKRPVDYHPQSDARVPLLSRIEGNEPGSTLSTRPSDMVSPTALGTASPGPHGQDPGHPSSRQSANDTAGGGGGGDLPNPPPRSNARPFPHHGIYHKKKFQKNHPHSAGPNNQGGAYGSPASDHPPPPRSGQGRPPSPSVPMSSTSRPVHPRSSSADGRRGRFPSPSRVWDRSGPPRGRDISRDRPPASYRGDYEPDVTPMRYGDTRSYGRDYSPPPPPTPFPPGERGPPGTYPSPSSGVAPGRDWGGYQGSYLPGNRRDWTPAEEEAYVKSRTWEGRPPPPPPPPSERDRYDYPPRSSNWVERDYPGRDSYPSGPPPAVDDRYNDRGRPAHSGYPPYNRVTRQRSPSPLRRGGPDSDDRPPVKRAREEYDPVEYYPPPPTAGRRGPGEYSHPPPPRASSPGPPPGSGASWPPPPASSGSTGAPPGGAGLPSDRDYRYPPPVSGGYDRPRSPGPPRGRPPYSRGGGYGRDGGRNSYPPRP